MLLIVSNSSAAFAQVMFASLSSLSYTDIAMFPFDTKKYGSFTISYVREKQNKQTDKSSIDDKYLDELCITKRNGIRKVMPLTDDNKEHFDKASARVAHCLSKNPT